MQTCPSRQTSLEYEASNYWLDPPETDPQPLEARFWTMPLAELTEWIGVNAQPGSRRATQAQAVFAARLNIKAARIVNAASEKAAQAAKSASDAAKSTSRATRWLFAATAVLAVAAVA
ncbi:MAG: hypothetical protein IIC71_14760 [Acidobacteria bacterium]|nr:hypothetical protein [Acidobacteriota bacterium]